TRARLPVFSQYPEFANNGGLLSYGPNLVAIYRRGAAYVSRILKGTKPADLPVEQPVEFKLVVNLRTANALGIMVPSILLARADLVIEAWAFFNSDRVLPRWRNHYPVRPRPRRRMNERAPFSPAELVGGAATADQPSKRAHTATGRLGWR